MANNIVTSEKEALFAELQEKAKKVGYLMNQLDKGLWELISKKQETDDVDEEADKFFVAEKASKKEFFDVLLPVMDVYFFFECIQKQGSNEITLCMWDISIHQPREIVIH